MSTPLQKNLNRMATPFIPLQQNIPYGIMEKIFGRNEKMAVSRPQQIAKDKYRQEKRDQITAEVPKGKRDAYKLIAAELNLSLSMLIQNGVEEYGRNHAGKDFLESLPTPNKQQDKKKSSSPSLSPTDERLLDDLAKLPPDAQRAFRQLVRAITAPANDDDQRRQKN